MKIARVLAFAIAVAVFPSVAGTILLTKEGGATRSQPTIATLLIDFKPKPGVKDEEAQKLFEASLYGSYGEPGQFMVEDAPPCVRTKAVANGYSTWVQRMVVSAKVPVVVTRVTYNCVIAGQKS